MFFVFLFPFGKMMLTIVAFDVFRRVDGGLTTKKE
jgi:hypothetical protein